jgi:hypothetical protein
MVMEYNDVRDVFESCSEFKDLDESARALLFWQGRIMCASRDDVIYADGEALDDSFCILLQGELTVEKAGCMVGMILAGVIFGEMAYFTRGHQRTATVKVSSAQAHIYKVRLGPADLLKTTFLPLREFLGIEAWDRFVSGSQSAV